MSFGVGLLFGKKQQIEDITMGLKMSYFFDYWETF